MAILSITTDVSGQIGVSPRIVHILTTDTNTKVTSVGYLNEVVSQGYVIYPTDVVFVILAGNTFGIYVPVISGGNYNLTPWVSSISPSFPTVSVIVPTLQMQSNTIYVANSSSLITFTLPANPQFGDVIGVLGLGSGGWKIAQAAGEQIIVGAKLSTVGTAGFIQTLNRYDSIYLTCVVAGTTWSSLGGPQGNLTIS